MSSEWKPPRPIAWYMLHSDRVGRTPLIKMHELTGRYGAGNVWVKDESKNPYGTFKDRRAKALLEKYKDNSELVLVHITSGNSGYSIGMLAEEERRKTGRDIRVVNIVDYNTPGEIKERLETCSTLVRMDLKREHLSMNRLKEIAKCEARYKGDPNNIVGVEEYHLKGGYSEMIYEIYQDLGPNVVPRYIFCPVGGGELAVELTDAAKEVWGHNAPKIVGVTIEDNVLHRTVDFIKKMGRTIADKLATPYSMFKELVKSRIKEGGLELMKHHPAEVEIAREYEYLNRIGVNAEPSAAVAFCGAKAYRLEKYDEIVIINTGKGLYDPSSLNKVWKHMLKPRLKKLGLVAAGAVFSLLCVFGYKQYESYKQTEHLNHQIQVSLIAATGGLYHSVDAQKIQRLCGNLPDMDVKRCGRILDASDFTERQLQFLIYWDRLDDDNYNMGMRLLAREWYLKYNEVEYGRPVWMPLDSEDPEEYKLNPDGFVIQSSRKMKYLFMTPRERHEATNPPPSPQLTGYPWDAHDFVEERNRQNHPPRNLRKDAQ